LPLLPNPKNNSLDPEVRDSYKRKMQPLGESCFDEPDCQRALVDEEREPTSYGSCKRIRVLPKAITCTEPRDKEMDARNNAQNRFKDWIEDAFGDVPYAHEATLSTRVGGEAFECFEVPAEGTCFIRHAKIHRSLLGWIESCSVAIKDQDTGFVSPWQLKGHARVALKVFDLSRVYGNQARENAMQELRLHARMTGHSNISPLLHSFRTRTCVVAVFPMYSGDLFEYLSSLNRPLTETQLRCFMRDAAQALNACHSQGVAHRDVSLENFCLDSSGGAVLIDFGMACEVDLNDGSMRHVGQVGKAKYMAPELHGRGDSLDGPRCDVFSLGVMFLLLLLQVEPWDSTCASDARFRVMVIHGELESALRAWGFEEDRVSASALDLLKGMLAYRPEDRFTMGQVLEHSWMTGVGVPSAG
jgi:serine/threonine protein kinase